MKFNHESLKIHVKHPKRLVIILCSAVLAVLIGIYVVMSFLNWQAYMHRSDEASGALKGTIETKLSASNAAPAPAADIDTIIKDFEKKYGQNPCQPAALYKWQTVLPALKEKETYCNDRFDTSIKVIDDLRRLTRFLKAQADAVGFVESAFNTTKTPTNYAGAATVWANMAEVINGSVSPQFESTAKLLTSKTDAVSAAYKNLAEAVKNEDKTAFDAAVKALDAAYTGLAEVAPEALKVQTTLTNDFITAYKKL